MFVVKRNQVIITALIVMIAVAGYLNYTDKKFEPSEGFVYSEEGNISALVPDTSNNSVYVNSQDNQTVNMANLTNDNVIKDNPSIALTPELSNTQGTPDGSQTATENTEPKPGEALFVNSSTDSSYFVQAKLDREQSRSKQRELLMDLINNENLEQAKKAEVADEMLTIQQKIEKESAAEAMIEAKGFKEVFVRIDDNTVDVVVNKENLTDSEIAQIEDIIKRKTGIEVENIRISPMKNSNTAK